MYKFRTCIWYKLKFAEAFHLNFALFRPLRNGGVVVVFGNVLDAFLMCKYYILN